MVGRTCIRVDGHKARLIIPKRSAYDLKIKLRWERYKLTLTQTDAQDRPQKED
jgi:hypothetical protein